MTARFEIFLSNKADKFAISVSSPKAQSWLVKLSSNRDDVLGLFPGLNGSKHGKIQGSPYINSILSTFRSREHETPVCILANVLIRLWGSTA